MSPKNEIAKKVYFEGFENIIERKSLYQLQIIQQVLREIDKDAPPLEDREKWVPYLRDIFVRQMLVNLRAEAKEYRKRYPQSDYASDVIKAKTENRRLFRIIEWDKAWLGEEFVQSKIIEAQERGDLNFLKRLGNAISKKPHTTRLIKAKFKKTRQLFLIRTRAVIERLRVNSPEVEDFELAKIWYKCISEAEWFAIQEFYDFDYYIKYLRRHRVIA